MDPAARRGGTPTGEATEFTLPSRGNALATCLRGLADGPVLITGEAGSGKTWLAGRIACEAALPRHWISIDLTPDLDSNGLVRGIARGLGLPVDQVDSLALADTLADEAVDGRRWGLILDEAHLASDSLLEAIRVLGNRLGRPDGLAALVLVGQSVLLRRLTMRAAASLAARLVARVHLHPIDADEAGSSSTTWRLAAPWITRRWSAATATPRATRGGC